MISKNRSSDHLVSRETTHEERTAVQIQRRQQKQHRRAHPPNRPSADPPTTAATFVSCGHAHTHCCRAYIPMQSRTERERVQTHHRQERCRRGVSALQSRINLVPGLALRHGPTDSPTHWFRASRHKKFSANFALPRNSASSGRRVEKR